MTCLFCECPLTSLGVSPMLYLPAAALWGGQAGKRHIRSLEPS